MMNDENLKPYTVESAKENGRKGGVASGKSKRIRKGFKTVVDDILSSPYTPDQISEKLLEIGFDEADITAEVVTSFVLVKKALNGDVKAFRTILEVTGELSPKKVNLSSDSLYIDEKVKELQKLIDETS